MLFVYTFYGLSTICALLYLYTRSKVTTCEDAQFLSFQRSYLTVYLLAVAGDWLQGPHVYALYESYNMSKHDIELLFVAGFGSSLVFGTFIASVADKYGRKSNCFLYGVLYAAACVTKHFPNFWILMIGRLLGGIATSILFSAFESWLVFEHNKRGFNEQLLTTIFSHATLGNSLIAIISGIVAQYAADLLGFVAPFDASLIVLLIMSVILMFTWPENYGDQKAEVHHHFIEAVHNMRNDGKVICLGLIQSLFEGAMYVFVLEWTPALTSASDGEPIPHGYIFASFMVAIMMGSSLFKMLSKYHRPESFMRVTLLVACICLTTPIIFPTHANVVFAAFLLFELCVGMFWPAMGFMRGIYIPEQTRSTIMNFCRMPLNAIVITILLQNLPMRVIFQCCVIFLLLASVAQQYLYRRILSTQKENKSDEVKKSSNNNNNEQPPTRNCETKFEQISTNAKFERYPRPVERILRIREGSLPNQKDNSSSSSTTIATTTTSLQTSKEMAMNGNVPEIANPQISLTIDVTDC